VTRQSKIVTRPAPLRSVHRSGWATGECPQRRLVADRHHHRPACASICEIVATSVPDERGGVRPAPNGWAPVPRHRGVLGRQGHRQYGRNAHHQAVEATGSSALPGCRMPRTRGGCAFRGPAVSGGPRCRTGWPIRDACRCDLMCSSPILQGAPGPPAREVAELRHGRSRRPSPGCQSRAASAHPAG